VGDGGSSNHPIIFFFNHECQQGVSARPVGLISNKKSGIMDISMVRDTFKQILRKNEGKP
jgi:hypothetical protein